MDNKYSGDQILSESTLKHHKTVDFHSNRKKRQLDHLFRLEILLPCTELLEFPFALHNLPDCVVHGRSRRRSTFMVLECHKDWESHHPDPQLRLESMSAEGLVDFGGTCGRESQSFQAEACSLSSRSPAKGGRKTCQNHQRSATTLWMIELQGTQARPESIRKLTILAMSFKTTISIYQSLSYCPNTKNSQALSFCLATNFGGQLS